MPQAASIEELLKAGAHFGHLTRRWNPKMREFIFMQRNGIHVIDLNKTHQHLQESLDAVNRVARSGKKILFVGTKKQAQEIIKTEALRCGMPYVTYRWLGGMLTNFSTVRKSIARMEEIDTMQKDGTYDNITKKERLMLDREKAKLEKVLAGISNMSRIPGAIFVVDTVKESIAMNEAIKLNIPIFAMVDTNCDPDIPDYIIPCNDDASRTIQLIASNFADAIIEGAAEREAYEEEQLAQEAADEVEMADEEDEELDESDSDEKNDEEEIEPEADLIPKDEPKKALKRLKRSSRKSGGNEE